MAKAVIIFKFLNDVLLRYLRELDKLELSYCCSIIFETSFEDPSFYVLIIIAPPIAPSPYTTDAGPVTTFILSIKNGLMLFELCT